MVNNCHSLTFFFEQISLNELDISSNPDIKEIKFSLQNRLPNLKVLKLANCGLIDFPFCFMELTNLRHLDISKNSIVSIDRDIVHPQLEELELSRNQLKSFPEKSCRFEAASLLNLYLSSNKLETVRAELMLVPKLQVLTVSNNKLQRIDFVLRFSRNLKEFQASTNLISSIPPDISSMNLQHLDLSYNDIEKIPDSFSKMHSLKSLYLVGNIFQQIPPQIEPLKVRIE